MARQARIVMGQSPSQTVNAPLELPLDPLPVHVDKRKRTRDRTIPEGRKYRDPRESTAGKSIPKWLLNKPLSLEAKLFYVTINSLSSNGRGAFMSHEHFAEDIGCRYKRVAVFAEELEDSELIVTEDRGSGRSKRYWMVSHEWMLGAKLKAKDGGTSQSFHVEPGQQLSKVEWSLTGCLHLPSEVLRRDVPLVARLCYAFLRSKYDSDSGCAVASLSEIQKWVNKVLEQSGNPRIAHRSTIHGHLCRLEDKRLLEGRPRGGRVGSKMEWRFLACGSK